MVPSIYKLVTEQKQMTVAEKHFPTSHSRTETYLPVCFACHYVLCIYDHILILKCVEIAM